MIKVNQEVFITKVKKSKSEMSLGWESLPLLPLRCILDHLSLEDALAAMSTCRHWRSAVMLYEGKKHILKLSTRCLEKNIFLTRIFKKHTKKLYIYILTERSFVKFNNFILPQFFDSKKLKELTFIGPSYIQQSPKISHAKLRRLIVESLIFKHSMFIEKIMYFGCKMDIVKTGHPKYTHKLMDYYSRSLTFGDVFSPADTIYSRCNTHLLVFSSLKHILVDYDQISTESLETLSNLPNFEQLSFNLIHKLQIDFKPIDWLHLEKFYPNGLDVAVNIIALPHMKLEHVIRNVFVERMQLTSLKVMFCKILYIPILAHVVRLYQDTLRELVWADSPFEAANPYKRYIQPCGGEYDTYNMNPFVLLCWQCVHLRRLVIHGYWIWLYDLLGFVRLSKCLKDLQVSSTYERQNRFNATGALFVEGAVRVLIGDAPETIDTYYEDEVNKFMKLEWKQTPWSEIHPALRAHSTPQQRMDYIVFEAGHPLSNNV